MKIKKKSLIYYLLNFIFLFNFIFIFAIPKFEIKYILIYIINILLFWFNGTLLNYYIK